ncbi:MAG: PH domain-containing protein [Gemmatimonadetes bacterium]|nr:PH domain-containing protein [Gemmatimonadota bacterium]
MPIDRGTLDQQLLELHESTHWWDLREFRDLPSVLHGNEQILALARGKIARVRLLRRTWLIVVTDRRILCLRSGGSTGWRQLEVRADQIERATLRVGPFKGRVRVVAGGQTYRLLVPRTDAYKLMTALSGIVTHAKETPSAFGPTRIALRVMDHMLALPGAALAPVVPRAITVSVPGPAQSEVAEQRLEMLEQEVQQLRQQVDFLEQLLRDRQPTIGSGSQAEPGELR